MSAVTSPQGNNSEIYNNPVFNSLREQEYETITELASITCNTPICLIALLDEQKSYFLKTQGLSTTQTPREILFFDYTMRQNAIFEVQDLTKDDRFQNCQFVMNHSHIRYFAGVPLTNITGKSVGCLCIMSDNPYKLTEEQRRVLSILAKQIMIKMNLRVQKKESERLAQIKEDFLSNISHELRTPMHAISGYADLLINTKLNSEQSEMLKIIKSSVEILITILNDVLDFAKINSGKLALENNTFNLKASLNSIYELLNVKAKEKNISFKMEHVNKVPEFIKGDKVRLLQILANLIGNAVKFTERGSVLLKTELLEETKHNYSIKFDVVDTGIGIAETKLKKIFNRFEQADTDTFSKFGGTGLGLNISKSLVELQNGQIEITSTMSKGSTFSVLLKFIKPSINELAELLSSPTNEPKKKPNFKNMKILLAEDTPINIKLIKKMLEGTNCLTHEVENGKQCIDKLTSHNYDLILMDLHMPHMDGYEATKYIRKILNLKTPIVALTANASCSEKDKCLNLGMNDFLTKPFKFEDLYKVVNKYTNYGHLRKNFMNTIKLRPIDELKLNNDKKCKFFKLRTIGTSLTPLNKLPIEYKSNNRRLSGISKIISASKVYNESVNYNTLKEFADNDKDLMKDLSNQFIKDLPSYLALLKESILVKNFVDIKHLAHKMKSPLSIFGMGLTKNILIEIEDFAVLNNIERIKEKYLLCENNMKRAITELSCK
jgi:signal transduction histidine kinase/response regulator of citrate/malate metabolism